MIRALTILAAIAALAVSAAPASAGTSKKPPPRGLGIASSEVFELNTVHKRPRAMGTRSGGEVVSDFAKAPAAMRLTAIKDGTSNTLEGVVDVIERDNGRRVSIGGGKDRGWFHGTGGDGRNTATGHSAGLAPDFGIYLSLRKAPPKPPRLSSRSGGEVISADAYVKAPRTVVTEKIGTTH